MRHLSKRFGLTFGAGAILVGVSILLAISHATFAQFNLYLNTGEHKEGLLINYLFTNHYSRKQDKELHVHLAGNAVQENTQFIERIYEFYAWISGHDVRVQEFSGETGEADVLFFVNAESGDNGYHDGSRKFVDILGKFLKVKYEAGSEIEPFLDFIRTRLVYYYGAPLFFNKDVAKVDYGSVISSNGGHRLADTAIDSLVIYATVTDHKVADQKLLPDELRWIILQEWLHGTLLKPDTYLTKFRGKTMLYDGDNELGALVGEDRMHARRQITVSGLCRLDVMGLLRRQQVYTEADLSVSYSEFLILLAKAYYAYFVFSPDLFDSRCW